jgi:hypothetical protein
MRAFTLLIRLLIYALSEKREVFRDSRPSAVAGRCAGSTHALGGTGYGLSGRAALIYNP